MVMSRSVVLIFIFKADGNVKDNSILEIWNGSKFKNLRNSLKMKDSNQLCAGCDHFGMNNLPKNFIKRKCINYYLLMMINLKEFKYRKLMKLKIGIIGLGYVGCL